jgi:1-pyrroline-5-carboxylate dehydrogenase
VDYSKGWLVRPALIQAEDVRYESMCEDIFGPVVSLHVYPDGAWEKTLLLVDDTAVRAHQAVFAHDRAAVHQQWTNSATRLGLYT